MKQKKGDVEEFLRESNAIEGVYDEDSLQQALYAWQYLIGQKKLTISAIKKTHKILMLHQPLKPDEKGYFRKVPVWISGREATQSQRVPLSMERWVKEIPNVLKLEGGDYGGDFFLKIHHIEYERIHPFIDGNGRTGRMFMNWERLKVGLPLLIIHEGEEQQRYYEWFK